jgi:hypothetical protein
MNSSKISIKQNYAERLDVAAKLIAAYVTLKENDKETAERFLALQVYGEAGMHPYWDFPEVTSESAVPSPTYEYPNFILYEPWSNWAQDIRESSLTDFERREAVRAMLGALIRQKDMGCLPDLDLVEAARTTLGWTEWDARNLAALRSLSPEQTVRYRAWLQKLVADERAAEAGGA